MIFDSKERDCILRSSLVEIFDRYIEKNIIMYEVHLLIELKLSKVENISSKNSLL